MIVDFDMAKLFALDKIHDSTSIIMRTSRYMAPEYVLQGEISVKSDVYSFGMLILEIVSGHRISSFQNGESTNDDLLSYAWTHWKGGSTSNVIDPMLRGISTPVHEITKCIHIALLCVQESVPDRPKMIEVLQMLNNLSIRLPEPLDPGLFICGSFSSEASSQFTKNVKSISDQYVRKMQKKAKSYAKNVDESGSSIEISPVESHIIKYELITIQNATNKFSKANNLRRGRYGSIYKGKLENGLEVAVKRLSEYSTHDLNPKIADFDLAWFFASDETHCEYQPVMGTFGYLAPEYLQKGELSIKTDVYSFGVLVLEIICGQKCFDVLNERTIGRFLTSYAWKQWINGSPSNIIHPMLRGVSSPVDDIIKCIQVALLCIQVKAEDRPTMSEVVQMLSNLSMSLPVPLAPPGDDSISKPFLPPLSSIFVVKC
ncbi:cysteine-rich receptor-like protein kinase 18 isoform X5 [Ipomoea triloba]|uniref:cysteine-rich receptor-like protein kinase 18 isoform X5 n=1 Tax=Ipomoea triloba TaxID=35885 RepID=UPI00125E8858|nr:cysteine-rich receptor-like protein kinase 18 isoform X5 [Ipomoea triloba]